MGFSANIADECRAAVERLCKWRTILAGWQLGTRPKSDRETQAIRDHRDATSVERAESKTLVNLLVKKRAITLDEFRAELACLGFGHSALIDETDLAVIEHREATLLIRAELNALVGLLLQKDIITEDSWNAQLTIEANELSESYSKRFDGVRAENYGLSIDTARFAETCRRLNFPL
ncbi:MAG: hypothetical protein ABFD89_17495 [Bryobacteraceae bacterium]